MPLWITLYLQTQSLARFSLALCSRSHTTLVCFRRTKFLCLMSILGGNHPVAPGRHGEGTPGGGSLAMVRCDVTPRKNSAPNNRGPFRGKSKFTMGTHPLSPT